MLKVLRRAFQDPMNAERNIPVALWHEMLVSGLPVPAYIKDKAFMYTLAYDKDGGILRDRAVVGVTKLGKNPRSATAEEKMKADKRLQTMALLLTPIKSLLLTEMAFWRDGTVKASVSTVT